MPIRCPALVLLMLGSVLAGAEPVNLLANGGFEDGWKAVSSSADTINEQAKVRGSVAQGWSDNSAWADVQVAYAADTRTPHSGATAQVLTVSRVASGAVQFTQGFRFVKGHAYAFSAWLRGRPGQVVGMSIRRAGAPYNDYATSEATISPEWKEFTVEGVVGDDVDGLVMFKVTGPMEVAIDDARLIDISAAATDAPPKVGNLLAGGSFEAGMPFGWSTRMQGDARWEHLDVRPVIDDGAAVDGTRSYRIDVPSDRSLALHSPVIHPAIGRPHTLSVWLKASRPDTPVRFELERTPISGSVTVGTRWQRVSVSGVMPFQRWTRVQVQAAAPADAADDDAKAVSLWVDGVQVEEGGEPSAYQPKAPWEATLRLARPGSVVFDGEAATVDVTVAPAPPAGARLALKAVDVFGAAYVLPGVPLPATGFPLPAMAERPRNVFKLTAVVEDAAGKALSSPVELVWSRLPKPRELDPASSFFGVHVPMNASYAAIARAIGARWVRLHDSSMLSKWPVSETAPGKWRFFDESVDAAHNAGLAVLGLLDGAPAWTASKPREGGYWGIWHIPDLPTAPAQWETYVRTMVGHYRGRIDAWEVWNEPWGDWWTGGGGSPELYAKLMQIAYTAAKQENPQVTIVGVDTYRGHEKWHEAVLAAGRLDSFDAFSFHDYNDGLYGGPESMAHIQAAAFTAAQAKYGTAKPLWNTEGGALVTGSFYAPETGGMALRRQLAQAVRYDTTMMGAGVQVFCYYALHSDPGMGDTEGRATEWDRAIKPLLAARAVQASLVDGAGVPQRSEPVPGVDVYTWPAREGSQVSVVWSHDGDSHRLPLPAGARVLDVLGNPMPGLVDAPVEAEPVYLIAPAP